MTEANRTPHNPVGLSTASVYPAKADEAFEIASRLGYDGVEVMVWTDPLSQDVEAIERLSRRYALPVLSVHAPCLFITQRVWGVDPWVKLEKSAEMALRLGAPTVVVHPPFRWQRDYARGFVEGVADLSARTGLDIAVENMFPWRARTPKLQPPRTKGLPAYAPDWDPTSQPYDAFTLDLSHAATSGSDGLAMAEAMGDRLTHIHLADGSGSARDEHLVPGHGNQPCAEVLRHVAARKSRCGVAVEVSTRKLGGPAERDAALSEALQFARAHLTGSVPAPRAPGAPAGRARQGRAPR